MTHRTIWRAQAEEADAMAARLEASALRLWPARRSIDHSSNFSMQHEVAETKVAKYTRKLERHDFWCFPPVRLVDYGSHFLVIDGHHRILAARNAGRKICALVVDGDAFESFDADYRYLGFRADDAEFWK